jgi:hypothetical protein
MTKMKIHLLCIMLLLSSGCMSVLVQGRGSNPDSPVPATYHGSLWSSTLWEEDWIASKSRKESLTSVRIRTNYLYALVTVITLGIYAPIDMEWRLNNNSELTKQE